jgi:hypothetical protein
MGKNPNKKQVNPSNKQEFGKAKEFVRTLASELDLAPREVQAALWAANILRTGGRPDSYEQYFKKQIDEKGLKERIENWRNKGYKPFSEIRKDAEASAKKEGATISSKSQKAQDNKIEDFVESQRKAGKSDSNIRTALELVADKLGLTPSDIDSLMSAEKKPAKKREFTKNILDIAKETGLSPQEVEDTYKKYDGSKDIQEVTVEDYNSARAAGDKVKLDNSKKAFEAFLSEDSNSPTAKKNAAKLKEELGKDTLKGAKKIMDNIDEIREKLLNAKVIKPVNCKWGK